MKNKILKLFLTAFALLLCVSLVSCGNVGYSEDDIKKVAEDLIEASAEINEIYFGKGFDLKEEKSAASALYSPVTDDCKYKSTSEIKSATEKVYSKDYCEVLFQRGFEGTADDNSEKVVYARFIDDFNGDLTQRNDVAENSLITTARVFDFSSAKIEKMKKNEAKISYNTKVEGEKNLSVTVTLLKEDNGWRLDTPTY